MPQGAGRRSSSTAALGGQPPDDVVRKLSPGALRRPGSMRFTPLGPRARLLDWSQTVSAGRANRFWVGVYVIGED